MLIEINQLLNDRTVDRSPQLKSCFATAMTYS